MSYPSSIFSFWHPSIAIPVTLTADRYWNHFPPQIQALRTAQDSEKAGIISDIVTNHPEMMSLVDHAIMMTDWDPVWQMILRVQEGFTWIPNAFQPNIPLLPGIYNAWNLPPYDPNHPPAGSITLISVNADDFPAFNPPQSINPSTTSTAKKVGILLAPGMYGFGPASFSKGQLIYSEGQTSFVEDGNSYIAVVGRTPMGLSGYIKPAA